MRTVTVQAVTADELARVLGIAENICTVFLSGAAQREPQAELRIQTDDEESWAVINFDYGDMLTLRKRQGFATIDCGGGFDQHFLLIPWSSVTDVEAVSAFRGRFHETLVVDDADLLATFAAFMAPVYDRINALRPVSSSTSASERGWLSATGRLMRRMRRG